MALNLTVLGCSGSYPGPGAACSGYLLRGRGVKVVVDLGTGTLANLQRHIPLADIDAVVLSHSHPDHWVDLTGLEVAYKYALCCTGLPVYGTAENRAMASALIDIEPTFDWHELSDGCHVRIGGIDLDFSTTDHYVETLAIRAACDGSTIAYSADTGPGWSFSELGGPIDLALCEATMLADGEGDGVLHLSARQAGAMARSAGVERLVLTHLAPGVDPERSRAEGQGAFGTAVTVATEHATFDV